MLPPQSLLWLGARAKSWVVIGGVVGKTISLVLLLGEREKKIFLDWGKINERHAASQTWDMWVTLFRAGNLEIFEVLIGEKETAKEYLSFNKLAIDISLSSRES